MSFSLSETLLMVWNVGITCGYLAAAVMIAPLLPVSKMTRRFGVAFFGFCGLTHLDHAIHVFTNNDGVQWHEHAITFPQMVAIWGFTTYFHRDLEDLARERQTTKRAEKLYG